MRVALTKARRGLPPGVVRTAPLSVTLQEYFDAFGRAIPASGGDRPFPAGEPQAPALARGAEPRALVPQPFGNLVTRPRRWRGKNLTPFEQLRALADFDLVRIAIEDVKGQILGMVGEIVVRKEFEDQAEALQDKVTAARKWLEHPDQLSPDEFPEWLGRCIEEVLTTDALSLYPRFSFAGAPLGLQQVDGATIVPLVDDLGRPPLPPAAAFQQIAHGRPETEFTLPLGESASPLEIWYLPRNKRPDTPYGRSPVENVLMTVNLALRQATHDLAYYTHGATPDSLYILPENLQPKQLDELQDWFDEVLSGRSERRAGGLRMMPKGEYHSTKEAKWQYEFMEWLGRVISWAFGVSPVPIARVMNRATSEQMEQSALEQGPRPVAAFMARVVTRYLQRVLDSPELEFRWADDEAEDATLVVDRTVRYVGAGIKTVNQARVESGDDPFEPPAGVKPEEFWANRPFVVAAGGLPVFMDTVEEERKARQAQSEAAAAALAGGAAAPNAAPAAGKTTEDEPAAKPAEASAEAAEKGWPAAWRRYRAAVVSDLRKWRTFSERRRGKPARAFASTVIPPALGKLLGGGFASDVAGAVIKGEPKPPKGLASNTKKLTAIVSGWLDASLPAVTAWAVAQIPAASAEKLSKSAPPLDPQGLFSSLATALADTYTAGAADAAGALFVDLETAPADALLFAQERAAELVGKKWIAGQLVDNPNPQFAITETLRSDVQSKVAQAIAEGWSPQELTSALADQFGAWRAENIARTETGMAYGTGAADVYEQSDVEHVEIFDGEGCLPSGHQAGAPAPSGAVGVVEEEAEANGQIWTVAQYRARLLGHPQCVRAAVPYLVPKSEESEAA